MKIVSGRNPYVVLEAFDLWKLFNDYLNTLGLSLVEYELDSLKKVVYLSFYDNEKKDDDWKKTREMCS